MIFSLLKHVRLLPAVLVVGTILLGLKGFGIVREAQAQDQSAQPSDPSPANDAATPPKDIANDDTQMASAAEVDVLTSLSKRRTELDGRTEDLDMRENVLAASEKRVDDKIAQLKQLQDQITQLLGQRDTAQEAQVKSLVKTYSAMKAKDAARIFNVLNDEVLIAVAQEMKSDALAPILAAMNADTAQKLTVKLANLLKLPDTASPAQPVAAAPPPTQQASAAPVPGAAPTPAPPAASPAPQTGAPQATPQAAAPKTAAAPQATAPQTAAPKSAAAQKPAPGSHG